MYSYQTLNSGAANPACNDPSRLEAAFTTKKRANDIIRAAVAKLRHEQYKAQLDHHEETYVANGRIESKLHHLNGIEVGI